MGEGARGVKRSPRPQSPARGAKGARRKLRALTTQPHGAEEGTQDARRPRRDEGHGARVAMENCREVGRRRPGTSKERAGVKGACQERRARGGKRALGSSA
jgi:hypothetical protein